ncbi:MAG: EamA family transporter, partial [Bacteroidales bacterium]
RGEEGKRGRGEEGKRGGGENLTARDQRPTANGPRPTANGPRPTANGQRPAANGQRPAANGQRPAANGPRPTANGQRPAANGQRPSANGPRPTANGQRLTVAYGLLLGLILFAGASFQQVGIVYTTAGNAGFITGLYIILVPVFGVFSGQKAGWNLWSGALLGAVGLYLLSVTGDFRISKGDLLVMLSAVFWAIHVLYTGWLAPRNSAIRLAITQYTVCSVLSFFCAFLFESNTLEGFYDARYPILYGGILSVGIAYTLQIVAQKKAPPSHAAIIMSLEAVFAVIGGMIILSETMTGRKWVGCVLMLCGMLLAQFSVGGLSRAKRGIDGQQINDL